MSVWDDIKDRLSVEEVIADYIPIKQSGSNYKAVCPFHQEKTPSLMISPNKGIWHCFGCGAGGDIFEFVSQIENLERKDVLERLASKAGVELKPLSREEYKKRQESKPTEAEISELDYGNRLLTWSADIYHKILLKILGDFKHPVTVYCRERNLTQQTIEKFKIGYAPKQNTVLALAQKHGLDTNLLLQAGVLKSNERGLSDKFKDRLMIPIQTREGQVVGFTGRVLPGDTFDRPKYLNSSQSQWFNKSELWFGLNHARPQIIRSKNAIIVEGNMDVVSCHQAGLETTIASQGTSFTDQQLKILKRMTRRVSLAFDNDSAGIIAGKKFYMAANKIGLTVDKLVIPLPYKDIDEYISENTKNGAQVNLEIIPFFEWYLQVRGGELRDGDMNIQRKAIDESIEVIESMDELSQEQAVQKLSKITSLSADALRNQVKSHSIPKNQAEDVEIGYDIKPRPNQLIINMWKNYISLSLADNELGPLSIKIYNLLQETIGYSKEVELSNYLMINQAEIDMVAGGLRESNIETPKSALQKLMIELDRSVAFAAMSASITQDYFEIKQFLNKMV